MGLLVWLLKRYARAQEDKVAAVIVDLSAMRAQLHALEIMLPQTYLSKREFDTVRVEMNENFREVQRDLKVILRSLGVKDAA